MSSFARLLDAELRRFWARRLVKVLLVLAALAITVVMSVITVRSRITTETQTTYRLYGEREIGDCIEVLPDGEEIIDEECAAEVSETETAIEERVPVDRRIDLVDSLENAVNGLGTTLMFFAVLIGASFLGAEIGAASLSTQLLYEPRRVRVWIAKAVAVGTGAALLSVSLLALMSLEIWGGAAWRGVVEGATSDWWLDRGTDVLRTSGAAALGAIIAFGVTGIARRTVGAVAGFLVLGMILEPMLTAGMGVFDGRLPVSALFSFASNTVGADGGMEGIDTLLQAATVGGAWTAAMLVAGGILFTRREIR